MSHVYLDAATAAPLHPAAREAMIAALAEGWADPHRLYSQSRRARHLWDASRAAAGEALNVNPDTIFFTPSGAISAQAATLGVLAANPHGRQRFIHSAIEHSAILHAAEWHERHGGSITSIPVNRAGVVDMGAFTDAVTTPDAGVAALMLANHEVGTLQPTKEAFAACQAAEIPLVVDASAAVGHADIASDWNLLTASAEKWGGPSGVGILAVSPHIRWRTPGPEGWGGFDTGNLPAVVGAAAALRARLATQKEDAARMSQLVGVLRTEIPRRIPGVEMAGDPVQRLPHILTFSCLYLEGEALVHALETRGFAVASGSSCVASTLEPSHVLVAMGVLTHGNIRVSLHPGITEQDVEHFLAALEDAVASLRREHGIGDESFATQA